MNRILSCLLVALSLSSCQRPASLPSPSPTVPPGPRLAHPEQLIIPPEGSKWPHPLSNGEFPHYPTELRDSGVEGRVVAAFVVDERGHPEYRTISILQSSPAHQGFVTSVCTFLRNGAEFGWAPHEPARALVIMPFEFELRGVPLEEGLPPKPNLRAVDDSLRDMAPGELTAWVESEPHCV